MHWEQIHMQELFFPLSPLHPLSYTQTNNINDPLSVVFDQVIQNQQARRTYYDLNIVEYWEYELPRS